MRVICSAAHSCEFMSCVHIRSHEHGSNMSTCGKRLCSLQNLSAQVKCVDVKNLPERKKMTSNLSFTEKFDKMKHLSLDKDVWYAGVPCFIDSINSGLVYSGNGDLRIVPKDRKLKTIFDKNVLQSDGKWVSIEDKYLSLVPPPTVLTWKNTKGSRVGNLDFNKSKTLGTLLANGSELLLNRTGFSDGKVTMSKEGDISIKDAKTGLPMTAYSSATVRRLMSEKSKKGEIWYVVNKET